MSALVQTLDYVDPFAAVMGSERGDLRSGHLFSVTLTPAAEASCAQLLTRAQNGALGEVLEILGPDFAQSQPAPAQALLQQRLLAWLCQSEAERCQGALTQWSSQFKTILITPTALQGLAATAIPVLKRSLNNLLRSALVVGRTELDKRAQAAVSDAYRHALLSTASQHVHAGDGELLAELLDLESGLIGEVAIGEGFDAKSFAALLSENIWLQVLREFTPQTLVYDDYSTFMRRRAHAAQTLMESLCENLTRNVRPRLAAQLCAESGSPHTRHPAVMVAELARERVRALNFSQEKIVAATSLSAAMVRKLLARSTRPRTQYGSGRIASLAPVQTFSAYLGMDWAVNYLCAITVELAPEHAKRLASGRLHASRYKNVRLCCEHLQTMGAPATALSRIRDIAAGDELPNTGDSSWQEPFRELVFWERVRLGL